MKYTEAGNYELNYTATDSCGNITTETREVIVQPNNIIVDQDITAINRQSLTLTQLQDITNTETITITISNPVIVACGVEYEGNADLVLTATVWQSQPYRPIVTSVEITAQDFPTSPAWGESANPFYLYLEDFNKMVVYLNIRITGGQATEDYCAVEELRGTHILIEKAV